MILRGSETVLVMGITGKQGTFWSERMRDVWHQDRGRRQPKRAGEQHLGLPCGPRRAMRHAQHTSTRRSCSSAVRRQGSGARRHRSRHRQDRRASTEHVPVHDTMYVLAAARERGAQMIGPNTAGIVTVGDCFAGFMPAFNPRVFQPGDVGASRARARSARRFASTSCRRASACGRSSASAAIPSSAPPPRMR